MKIPFISSSDDDDDDLLDNVETTGGSKAEGDTVDVSSDEDEEAVVDADDFEEDTPDESVDSGTGQQKELTGKYKDQEKEPPEVGDFHKDLIAPSGITPQADVAKVGDAWTRTYFINGWPDDPENNFLQEVLMQNDIKCDISLHIRPYESETAINRLESDAHKARTYLEDSTDSYFAQKSKQKDLDETLAIYNTLKDTNTELFDVGMYLTVRGDSEDEVIRASDDIVRLLRSSPTLTNPEIAKYNQTKALQTVSPVMVDNMNYQTEMMGGAIGAMFPFTTRTIYEPNGVDFGRHAGNTSPVIVNRFEARDTGYNQLTIGDIGSGKSFSTKLNILRTYMSRDDLDVFIIDPLRGFESVTRVLGGTEITVGGSLGINPLEIQKTPEEVLENQPDIDPYGTQLSKVMDFFEMFFAQMNLKLGDAKSTLQIAVEQAYEEAGITRDISTHTNDSPTVRDVVRIIEDMVENPAEATDLDSDLHRERFEDHASQLATVLQQFKKGGRYQNLGGESDIDFEDNDMFYLDLSQQEGSGSFGIIMHILLSEVYEYAKQTDNKVLLAIDEAHYLMKDAQSLEYLTHVVRHSRHHNLSINFVTQTIEEFFSHEESETIAQNTSLKLFQRVDSGIPKDIADILDMTEQERQFVASAQPGKADAGYSEALLGVEHKGYYPLHVVPSELEIELLTFEPKHQTDKPITEVANRAEGVNVQQRPEMEQMKEVILEEEQEDVDFVGEGEDEEDEEIEETAEPEEATGEEYESRVERLKEEYGIDVRDVVQGEEAEDSEETSTSTSVDGEQIEDAQEAEEASSDEEAPEEGGVDEGKKTLEEVSEDEIEEQLGEDEENGGE